MRVSAARDSLIAFAQYVNADFEAHWFHRELAEHLEKLVIGEWLRLITNMPPRHGKSLLATVMLASWYLGHHPDKWVIVASYAAPLAEDLSDKVRDVIASEEYQRVFPGVRLATAKEGKASKAEWEIAGFKGGLIARGVGGGLTGRGGDLIIIDDPIGDGIEARSETTQRNVWEWYNRVVRTRRQTKNAAILLMMTRWHVSDLAGKLHELSNGKADTLQWHTYELKGLREEGESSPADPRQPGEALWEAKITAAELLDMKSDDPAGFAALYQQRPIPESGVIIAKDWLDNRWTSLPNKAGITIKAWDCRQDGRSKTSAYAVCTVWFRPYGEPNVYLVDLLRGRWSLKETEDKILYMDRAYQGSLNIIEDAANGKTIIAELARHARLTVVLPRGSKENRLRAVSTMFEAGHIWLPSDEAITPRMAQEKVTEGSTKAPRTWLPAYIQELITFPQSTYMDQVDTTSMALQWLQERTGGNGFFYRSGAKRTSAGFRAII